LATSYPSRKDLTSIRANRGKSETNDEPGHQLDEAKEELRERDEDLHQATQNQGELVRRYKERRELARKYAEIEKDHQLHCKLAELLGPRGLQLRLLRDAERDIVKYANAVLDRLSGGQISLRLRGEENSEASAGKALMLEAVDRGATINVELLSGSQKFRVAVSIALGIGQYGGRQRCPIESVIIDEGFGCLDANGRDFMIQELQNLSGQLRRILLVSHQDEFARAIRDGYRIEVGENGSRQVNRFDEIAFGRL
jgi:DNA repair protein SbcC/Rad50